MTVEGGTMMPNPDTEPINALFFSISNEKSMLDLNH